MRNRIDSLHDLSSACVGCGLCEGSGNAVMEENEEGFMRPVFNGGATFDSVADFCPVVNLPTIYEENPWGRCEGAYLGWSANELIREKASSGGIVSAILKYALEKGYVDHVLHVGSDVAHPLYAAPVVSSNAEDVLRRSGSRYVSCSSVAGLSMVNEMEGRFAVVGRPCEIRALNAYLEKHGELASRVVLTLSFFCAGLPSRKAARRLLGKMGASEGTLASFSYRGDGWPGYATAILDDGRKLRLTYDESWGSVLGRDIEDYCKFCFDGVGEYADISAGDAWCANPDGTPNFSEGAGRNIVFARSRKGLELIEGAVRDGAVKLDSFSDWQYLKGIQKAQYERKCLLRSRLCVLRLFGKKTCSAKISDLKGYADRMPLSKKIKTALGLIKRLTTGRITLP